MLLLIILNTIIAYNSLLSCVPCLSDLYFQFFIYVSFCFKKAGNNSLNLYHFELKFIRGTPLLLWADSTLVPSAKVNYCP